MHVSIINVRDDTGAPYLELTPHTPVQLDDSRAKLDTNGVWTVRENCEA